MLLQFIFIHASIMYNEIYILKNVIPNVEALDDDTKEIYYNRLQRLFLSINEARINQGYCKNSIDKNDIPGSMSNETNPKGNLTIFNPQFYTFQNITDLLIQTQSQCEQICITYKNLHYKVLAQSQMKNDLSSDKSSNKIALSQETCVQLQEYFDKNIGNNKEEKPNPSINIDLCLILYEALFPIDENAKKFCKLQHMIDYFCIISTYETSVFGDKLKYLIYDKEKLKKTVTSKTKKQKKNDLEQLIVNIFYHVTINFNGENLEELKYLKVRRSVFKDYHNIEKSATENISINTFLFVDIGALEKKIKNSGTLELSNSPQIEEPILDLYHQIYNNVLKDKLSIDKFFCLGSTWSLEPNICNDNDYNAILCFAYKSLDYRSILEHNISRAFDLWSFKILIIMNQGPNINKGSVYSVLIRGVTSSVLDFWKLSLRDYQFNAFVTSSAIKISEISKKDVETKYEYVINKDGTINKTAKEYVLKKVYDHLGRFLKDFTTTHYKGITTEKLAFLFNLIESSRFNDKWSPLLVSLKLLEKSELIVYPQKTGILSTLQKYIEDHANKERRLNVQVFFLYETYMQHVFEETKDKSGKKRLDQIKSLSDKLRDLFIEEVKCIKTYHEFINNCEFDVKVEYKLFRGSNLDANELENKYEPKGNHLKPYDFLIHTQSFLFYVMNKKPKESNFNVTKFCIFQHQFLGETPDSVVQLKKDFNLLVGNIDTKAYLSKKANEQGDTQVYTAKDFSNAYIALYTFPDVTDEEYEEKCRQCLEALKEKLVSENGILRKINREIMPDEPKKYLFEIKMRLRKNKLSKYIESKRQILLDCDMQNLDNTTLVDQQDNDAEEKRRKNIIDIISKAINDNESNNTENELDTVKNCKKDAIDEDTNGLQLFDIHEDGILADCFSFINSFDTEINTGEAETTFPLLLIIIYFLSENSGFHCDMYPFNTQASLDEFRTYYKNVSDKNLQKFIKGRKIYIGEIEMYVDIYFYMLNNNEADITERFSKNINIFQNDLDWKIDYGEARESINLSMGFSETYITFITFYHISVIYIDDDTIKRDKSNSDVATAQTTKTRRKKRPRKKKADTETASKNGLASSNSASTTDTNASIERERSANREDTETATSTEEALNSAKNLDTEADESSEKEIFYLASTTVTPTTTEKKTLLSTHSSDTEADESSGLITSQSATDLCTEADKSSEDETYHEASATDDMITSIEGNTMHPTRTTDTVTSFELITSQIASTTDTNEDINIKAKSPHTLSDEDIAHRSVMAILHEVEANICTEWDMKEFKQDIINEITKQDAFADKITFEMHFEHQKMFDDVFNSFFAKNKSTAGLKDKSSLAEEMLKALLLNSVHTLSGPLIDNNRQADTTTTENIDAQAPDNTEKSANNRKIFKKSHKEYQNFVSFVSDKINKEANVFLGNASSYFKWIFKNFVADDETTQNDKIIKKNLIDLIKTCKYANNTDIVLNALHKKESSKVQETKNLSNKEQAIQTAFALKIFSKDVQNDLQKTFNGRQEIGTIEYESYEKILGLEIFVFFISESDLRMFIRDGSYTNDLKSKLQGKFDANKLQSCKLKEMVNWSGFFAVKYLHNIYKTDNLMDMLPKPNSNNTQPKKESADEMKRVTKQETPVKESYRAKNLSGIRNKKDGKHSTQNSAMGSVKLSKAKATDNHVKTEQKMEKYEVEESLEKAKIWKTVYTKVKNKIIEGYMVQTFTKVFDDLAVKVIESCKEEDAESKDEDSRTEFMLPNSVKHVYYKVLVSRKENEQLYRKMHEKLNVFEMQVDNLHTRLEEYWQLYTKYKLVLANKTDEIVSFMSILDSCNEIFDFLCKDEEDIKMILKICCMKILEEKEEPVNNVKKGK